MLYLKYYLYIIRLICQTCLLHLYATTAKVFKSLIMYYLRHLFIVIQPYLFIAYAYMVACRVGVLCKNVPRYLFTNCYSQCNTFYIHK